MITENEQLLYLRKIARNRFAANESEAFLKANGMLVLNYNIIKDNLEEIEALEKRLAEMKSNLADYCEKFGGLEKVQEIMRLSDEVQNNYILSDEDFERFMNERFGK